MDEMPWDLKQATATTVFYFPVTFFKTDFVLVFYYNLKPVEIQ